MAVYEVSAHTSRLINGFSGVEQKVQPFYDLKYVEMLIGIVLCPDALNTKIRFTD